MKHGKNHSQIGIRERGGEEGGGNQGEKSRGQADIGSFAFQASNLFCSILTTQVRKSSNTGKELRE